MSERYSVGGRDYLRRARSLLAGHDAPSLFHAAFELRAGIEARMQEYLHPWPHVSKRSKNQYQIAKLASGIEEAFSGARVIVEFEISEGKGDPPLTSLFYTPVTPELQKTAERLGEFLHPLKQFREPNDPWWQHLRSTLNDAARQLDFATKGTLLGPPLWKPATREAKLNLEMIPNREIGFDGSRLGQSLHIKVGYHPLNLDFRFPDGAYIWDD